jgi:hypothetical protein
MLVCVAVGALVWVAVGAGAVKVVVTSTPASGVLLAAALVSTVVVGVSVSVLFPSGIEQASITNSSMPIPMR